MKDKEICHDLLMLKKYKMMNENSIHFGIYHISVKCYQYFCLFLGAFIPQRESFSISLSFVCLCMEQLVCLCMKQLMKHYRYGVEIQHLEVWREFDDIFQIWLKLIKNEDAWMCLKLILFIMTFVGIGTIMKLL